MPIIIGAFDKTKNDVLDFSVDWSNVLVEGETITNLVVTTNGVILASSPAPSIEQAGTMTTWWLSGGSSARAYTTIRITTTAGRTYERQVAINIQ